MDALLTTYGFNAQNRNAIIATEGINQPEMLLNIELDDVGKMLSALGKLPVQRGGSFIEPMKQKNFEALIRWVKDQNAQGINILTDDFTPDVMRSTKELMKAGEVEPDTASTIPSTFNIDDWTDDHFLFVQHLKQCKRADGLRDLTYVIRPDMAEDWVAETREERQNYAAALNGA